ncbi:MAG: antibiotic biosynthesis monooxygenase [Actinobacteria bacterium]|nr:antibiotic biosynthesis monooxygenase [Actinomycetota bacterium]
MSNPSPWPALDGDAAALLVITRHRAASEGRESFLESARRAVAVLSEQAGFLDASIAVATDEAGLYVIETHWIGVGAYRRALSSFDVKMTAIPLLSTAVDESSAFEIVHRRTPGTETSAHSGLAADAGEVGLGSASGPDVRSVTS